jgi:hypothetical protein
MNDDTCVIVRPVAAWAVGHADPARMALFAHRWAGTRTTDLEVLSRRRQCFIELVQQVGDANLAAKLATATADWQQRAWESEWLIDHWNSRFARNAFITLLPALDALDSAEALALVFRFFDDTCPMLKPSLRILSA